jgi:hypothetical protein
VATNAARIERVAAAFEARRAGIRIGGLEEALTHRTSLPKKGYTCVEQRSSCQVGNWVHIGLNVT